MRYFIQSFFWRDRIIAFCLITALLINILLWILLYLGIEKKESVILHYNIKFGADLTGVYWQIFLIPVSGLLLYFLNFILAYLLYSRERLASQLLLSAVVFAQIILFIACYLLVGMN